MNRRALILGGAAALTLTGGAALLYRSRPVDPFTGYVGMAAPEEPVQNNLPQPLLVEHPVADLWLFAEFSLTALVLSSKTYRDHLSAVIPLDLALGWGPSSDPDRIRGISYWQRDRWYLYRSSEPLGSEMAWTSANMHMIPATPLVEDELRRARKGNLVQLSGHLCDVRFLDRPVYPSSRTRRDTGAGACEVVHVSRFRVLM